jgi:ATP-binding cassette, subfamily C (CFTR/MRP), member 1
LYHHEFSLSAIALIATSSMFAIGCLKAARDLHNKILFNVFRLPMTFFDTLVCFVVVILIVNYFNIILYSTPLGRILNRFSKDINTIDNALPQTMRFWMMMFFNAVAVIVVITISTPIFASVVVPLGILYYLIQRFYVSTSRQLMRIESITRSPIYTHFSETITGQSSIRAYGEEQR